MYDVDVDVTSLKMQAQHTGQVGDITNEPDTEESQRDTLCTSSLVVQI